MPGTHRQCQRVRAQRFEPQAFHGNRVIHPANDKIQHIGLELVDQAAVHAGLDGKPDLGMRGAEAQQGIGQHRRHDAGQCAQPDALLWLRLLAGHAVGRRIDIREDAQGVAQEARAGGGQFGARALAHQQACAGQLLQLAQGLGHGWLRQPQAVGGAAQVLGLRHRHEAIEMPQPHAVAEDFERGRGGGFHAEKLS
ncbi:hypothetical protein D3C81_1221750 [compost metagenome]